MDGCMNGWVVVVVVVVVSWSEAMIGERYVEIFLKCRPQSDYSRSISKESNLKEKMKKVQI